MRFRTLLISLLVAGGMLACWECYWRNQGFRPYHDDIEDLWSNWRRQVPKMKNDEILILGSSRMLFDINLDVWEKELGKRPVMLAGAGKSPGPFFKDLIDNTDFSGTLLVGVAPDLFFDVPNSGGWKRAQSWLDFYNKETYAQRLNQAVFMQIDPYFAYINDNLKLKELVFHVPLPQRDSVRQEVIWPDMKVMDEYRNLQMIPEMEHDTVMQNAYKNIWSGFGWPETDTTQTDTIINMYVGMVKAFEGRGGKVIFVRAPSTEDYLAYEAEQFPRKKFWDRLLFESGVTGVHFHDYPGLTNYDCPEWSHLLPEDAKRFTYELIAILKEENLINQAR